MSDGKPESGVEYFMENNGITSKENITKTKYMQYYKIQEKYEINYRTK
jgi:hypothetical protein